MIHEFTKNITCTDIMACALLIQDKLETPSLKLHANKQTDIVNGYISIIHKQNAHNILIEIYDNNQLPNRYHKSTFKKPQNPPTQTQLGNKL